MTEETTIQENVHTKGTTVFDRTGIRIEVIRGTIGIFGPHAPKLSIDGRSEFDSLADAHRFRVALTRAEEIFGQEVMLHDERVERYEVEKKERQEREVRERQERYEIFRREREERIAQAEKDREERRLVEEKRANALAERKEMLLHEFADEPVRARAKGYKQAVRAIVRVRETRLWERERQGLDEFVPYIEYVYDNDYSRPTRVEDIWRLEVKSGSRYRVLWDDGRSDLGHDKGADAINRDPKIKEYDASEEPV